MPTPIPMPIPRPAPLPCAASQTAGAYSPSAGDRDRPDGPWGRSSSSSLYGTGTSKSTSCRTCWRLVLSRVIVRILDNLSTFLHALEIQVVFKESMQCPEPSIDLWHLVL